MYAAELNKKLNDEIVLFHSNYIPVPATDIPFFVLTEGGIQTDAGLKLDEIKKQFETLYPEIKFNTKICVGLCPNSESFMQILCK